MRSVKDECLSKLILLGEASLRRALREYLLHYHQERNHQGRGNMRPDRFAGFAALPMQDVRIRDFPVSSAEQRRVLGFA